MGFFSSIRSFYAISAPAAERVDPESPEGRRYYRRLSLQTFVAATLGYGMYYVCRTSLNVMKKPILDSGLLDAAQLGVVSSALLFAYAAGKFVNGFVCDYCNIRRFMATGLVVSLSVNLLMGLFGFAAESFALPSALSAVVFAVMWGVNGWSQSMGSPPAIISLSRWFPLSRRGTFYGFFSTSHNLGEFFSFLFVGLIVASAGWQWGFVGSAAAGVLGTILVIVWMHDTPESKGLPPIERISHEKEAGYAAVRDLQREVVRMPAVWVLAAASAFMYMSRYAINGWGMLYLQKVKGMSDETALFVISVSALFGVIGTVFSGWVSDSLFRGNRSRPALFFGVLNSLSETAQNNLCNIVTIFLGVSVGCKAKADTFLTLETVEIIILGLLAFCLSTVGGLLIGKVMCKLSGGKINPLIGSAGVSAVPMAARVSQIEGQKANPANFLLMHAMGPNVAGVIGSAVAAGFMLKVFGA